MSRIALLVKEYAQSVAALSGLLGALIYALVSLLLFSIYRPLGVMPSEVGLGYGRVLLASAVVVIATTVFAVMFEGLAYASSQFAHWWGRTVFSIAMALVVALIVALATGSRSTAFVIVPIVALLVWVLGRVTSSLLREARPDVVRVLAVLLPGTLVVCVLAFRALEDTPKLKNGELPNRLYLVPVPWDARVAHVSHAMGAAASAAKRFPKCMLLLGEADGTTVLYDATPGNGTQFWCQAVT